MANETDKAGAVSRPAQTARDTTKRMADVSLDALRTGSDQARTGMEQGADATGEAFRFARQGGEEAQKTASEWMAGSAGAARFAMEAGQEITSAMLDFTRQSMQRGVDGMTAMARCRTVPELLAVQGDLVRDGLREAVSMGQKMVEITMRASGQNRPQNPGSSPQG